VPGHWEGLIAKPPKLSVSLSLQTVPRLHEHLWQSLTWNQGREMAQHVQFSIDTGVDVYFCDPKSPWQRENLISQP